MFNDMAVNIGTTSGASVQAELDGRPTTSGLQSNGDTIVNFLQQGSGVAPRQLREKLRDVVSVKDYGAKGDGTTDDSAAIQNASYIANYFDKTLFFPEGVYIVAPNAVFMQGESWLGAGRTRSIIKAKPVTFSSLSGLVSCQSQSDFTISDMGFDFGGATYPAGTGNPGNIFWALAVQLGTNWRVFNCAFTNIKAHCQGLAVDGGSFFEIVDNYFHMPTPSNSYNQSVNISNASGLPTDYKVCRNTLRGSGLFSNGARGTISENIVDGWGFGGGISIGPSPDCMLHIVTGNRCSNGFGVDVNNVHPNGIENWSKFTIIADNLCSYNSGDGIGNGGYSCKITGNICLNNGQGHAGGGVGDGIGCVSTIDGGVAYTASDCFVTGNIMADTQAIPTQRRGYGEYVSGSAPAIYNNHVSDNKITGFVVAPILMVSGLPAFRGPQLAGSKLSSPGSLAAGATYNDTLSIAGARKGDMVKFGYNVDTRGFAMTGNVDTDNNVIIHIQNISGATKTFPAGATLNVAVEKPLSYGKYW